MLEAVSSVARTGRCTGRANIETEVLLMSPSPAFGRGGRTLAAATAALASVAALALPSAAAAEDKPFRLTLLHNNDAESKLLTGDSLAGYGGIGRYKTVVDRLRAEADAYTDAKIEAGQKGKGTVMVSSGDNFLAGLNLNASLEKGVPWYDSIAFDALGYDAATLGNHDFDIGPKRLADFIEGIPDVPFLSANLSFDKEPALKDLLDDDRIVPSTVVDVGGDKVGVVGLTTTELRSISSPGRRIWVNQNLKAFAQREINRLRGLGVNKIILSSHLQGMANEQALIPQLTGVDIVIAGGGDELLASGSGPLIPGGMPVGPYPTVVQDRVGRDVPIITTQGELRYVGRLTVEFSSWGTITKIDADKSGPVRVSGTVGDADVAERDPQLVTDVEQPLMNYAADLNARVLGTTDVLLNGGNPDPIRVRESNLGNLVTDAFLHSVDKAGPAADMALQNGGGIRASIPAGDITEAQTFGVLPFSNNIVMVNNVPRSKVKELLEHGYAVVPSTSSAGRFAHIAGGEVSISTACTAQQVSGGAVTTPGKRVRDFTLDDGTKIVEDGAVVAGPGVDIATIDFLVQGGDGYPFGNLTSQSSGVAYSGALKEFIVDSPASGGLGGVVSSADYPAGGEGRISISAATPAGGC